MRRSKAKEEKATRRKYVIACNSDDAAKLRLAKPLCMYARMRTFLLYIAIFF